MNHRFRLAIKAWVTVFLVAAFFSSRAATKPNILFIFADDQCYETIHALGNAEIETPNLDRLVRRGVAFTRAYNMGSWSGAVCVASRTMLNTGRFLWRAHQVYDHSEQERQAGRFWSEYMKKAGYDTYMTGKWHLKADAHKAFDHVVHVRPGMPNQTELGYNRPIEGQPDPWKPWDKSLGGFWEGGTHWSEVLAQDAIGFLYQAAQHNHPFFMYLAFNASHDPRQSPKEYVDKYPLNRLSVPVNFLPEYPYKDDIGCGPGLRDERLAPFPRTKYAIKVHRQEYYALITHMDAQIGKILDALEKTGRADRTWIFFTADHGLAVGHHGLVGNQNMYEDSVRVPFFVVGPRVTPGKKVATPIYLQDVMPTVLELAGVPKPNHVQFKSLLPLIRGERVRPPYDAIYGAYLGLQRMVTQDGFKLILYPKIGKALLYHLTNDPDEMRDLSGQAKYRPVMKRLFATFRKLQKETGDTLDLRRAFPNL
jgi:arylsulfatase A-like enzyme